MPLGSAFVGRQPDYDPANTAAYMFEPDDRVTETSPRPGWPTSCPPEAVGTGHFLQKPGMTGFSAPTEAVLLPCNGQKGYRDFLS